MRGRRTGLGNFPRRHLGFEPERHRRPTARRLPGLEDRLRLGNGPHAQPHRRPGAFWRSPRFSGRPHPPRHPGPRRASFSYAAERYSGRCARCGSRGGRSGLPALLRTSDRRRSRATLARKPTSAPPSRGPQAHQQPGRRHQLGAPRVGPPLARLRRRPHRRQPIDDPSGTARGKIGHLGRKGTRPAPGRFSHSRRPQPFVFGGGVWRTDFRRSIHHRTHCSGICLVCPQCRAQNGQAPRPEHRRLLPLRARSGPHLGPYRIAAFRGLDSPDVPRRAPGPRGGGRCRRHLRARSAQCGVFPRKGT